MQLDNIDYQIVMSALYNLAMSDNAELSDDVSALSDDELEQRLLGLREHFARLERKSSYD